VDLTSKTLSQDTQNVVRPLHIAKQAMSQNPKSLGIYIISMASSITDVLEVLLLMHWYGVKLPIAPLFETRDDLD